jgi:pyruvate dehydrogenase E2 component (dihydrolipoamide acetyltransferase)
MAHPILMPKPGQMTEECVLVAWHKDEGDPVRKGDVLFEIESDKANMDVEAFDEGVLLKRYVAVGETVPVNALCAYVGEPGEVVPETAPKVASEAPAASPAAAETTTPEGAHPGAPAATRPAAAAPGAGERLRISPRAARVAAASGIDPRTIAGTGPQGRIIERDVLAALKSAPAAPAAPAPAPAPVRAPSTEEVEPPQPMSRMRRIIAERLTLSATTTPQFTVTVSVDMTRLLALRTELKAAGTVLTVTDFIAAATAQTLAEFPAVNSRTDGTSVWSRHRVHLGLAVSLPTGLVVPVIRDAETRSLTELHALAAQLAEAARNGALSPDEMTGSTFTISNLGMFGVDEFAAIVNPGESAILAVSSIVPTPVVVGDGIGIRQIMKLTLTSDHRLVDGELAARFVNGVRRRLEDAQAFRNELLNG